MLYRAVLFTFVPTLVELVLVVCILGARFSPMVALLVRRHGLPGRAAEGMHASSACARGRAIALARDRVVLAPRLAPPATCRTQVGGTFVLYVAWSLAMTQVRAAAVRTCFSCSCS